MRASNQFFTPRTDIIASVRLLLHILTDARFMTCLGCMSGSSSSPVRLNSSKSYRNPPCHRCGIVRHRQIRGRSRSPFPITSFSPPAIRQQRRRLRRPRHSSGREKAVGRLAGDHGPGATPRAVLRLRRLDLAVQSSTGSSWCATLAVSTSRPSPFCRRALVATFWGSDRNKAEAHGG